MSRVNVVPALVPDTVIGFVFALVPAVMSDIFAGGWVGVVMVAQVVVVHIVIRSCIGLPGVIIIIVKRVV